MLKQLIKRLKKRAMSAGDIEWEFYKKTDRYPTFFIGDGENYLLYTDIGRLYKVPVSVEGISVSYGDPKEVYVEHIPVSRSQIVIQRTEEGLKFVAIAGAATLNRSQEIDSRSLFDDMVENFVEGGDYPINFYHVDYEEKFIMGNVARIQREGNLLLAYGIIDEETALGSQAARNFSEDEYDWGISIEFYPTEAEEVRTSDADISLMAYTKGRFKGLAVALEEDVSHYFTKIVSE